MKRVHVLAPAMATALIGLFLRPSLAHGSGCPPCHPPDPCPLFGTLLGGQVMWDGCAIIGVDIVEHSFDKPCDACASYCPGCSNCKECFKKAIRENAIPGWNAAHSSAFGWPKWVEVPGRPYAHKFQMYDHATWQRRLPGRDPAGGTTITDPLDDSFESCCGNIIKLAKSRTYIPYTFASTGTVRPWNLAPCSAPLTMSRARRAVTHELGHSIWFADAPGFAFDTVMDEQKCFDWPQLADGQALACKYNMLYLCKPCQGAIPCP